MNWNVNIQRYRSTLQDYREQFERRCEDVGERYRMDCMHFLILPFTLASGLSLYLMRFSPTYLYTALIVGILLGLLDLAVEHAGIIRGEWNYPYPSVRVLNVPVEIPLISTMCGILLTFIYYCFGYLNFRNFMLEDMIAGINLTQLVLIGVGCVFFFKYFTRKEEGSLILWALPWGVALYLEFPEPWILAVALLPVYIDYYLEKNILVKKDSLSYNKYDHEMAVNVALSYFPVAVLFLGLAALLVRIMN